MTTLETWMPEAWKTVEHLHTKTDLARCIAAWMETAAQAQRNCDYYRTLVERCGEALGESAKTDDAGKLHDDVLCAKVPELVEQLVARTERDL